MVLYGPWGSGKTTILLELENRFRQAGIPCGRSPATHCLEDIVQALAAAYPAVDTTGTDPEVARARLAAAAEASEGILLLDHLTDVSSAMVRLVRRLHSGTVGVLSAVDLEVEHERLKLRPWRLGALSVRMPPDSAERLSQLLEAGRREHHLPALRGEFESQLIRAAQGRPGWILHCIELERQGRYWQDDQLLVSLLCEDTNAALLQSATDALGLERAAGGGIH